MSSCTTPSHNKVQSAEEAFRTLYILGYFELEKNLKNAKKDTFYGQYL